MQGGEISYALIANGRAVLTECSTSKGNFPQVTRQLLNKIPPKDDKISYIYDSHVFHYVVENKITFLCMADEEVDQTIAFNFLEAIKQKFDTTYGDRRHKLIAYSIDIDFKRVLEKELKIANVEAARGDSKITDINQTLAQVKETMHNNIHKVVERGERIEILVEKSDNLSSSANQFRTHSKTLKNQLWLQNKKYMCLLIVIVLFVIYLIAGMACGFALNEC